MMRAARPMLAVLAFVLALPSAAQASRFYLSTERVFAPGQAPQVKLEANGVSSLDVRLYKLDDPRAWFDKQRDLHRPEEENEEPRPSTVSLLNKGARAGLSRLLDEVRESFGGEGRDVLKRSFPALHESAMEGDEGVEVQEVLPPLREHVLLDAWRHVLPDRGGWIYDAIAVPVSDPGAYLVEAVAGEQVAYTVVLVTDVALVTKQSSERLLVWAVDPASGDPRPGTEVTVLVGGEEKEQAKTGSDGIARFDLGLTHAPVLYATLGKSFTLLDPRFFSANLPEPRAYVYTERPVYRPGQEVFFKGFAREVKDELYKVQTSDKPVQVKVINPEGTVLEQLEVSLSERGSFDGAFELPEEPVFGTWQIVAEIDGKQHGGRFKVMSYIKPEVKLAVRLDNVSVRAGDALTGIVDGQYFFGAPYPDAEVKLTVTRTRFYIPWYVDADYSWYYSEAEYRNTKREVIEETECTLDEKGQCEFDFPTEAGTEDFTYVIEASAKGPTGKTITGRATSTVTRGAFRLVIEQDSLIVKPGKKQTLRLKAEDYSRRPVKTDITVRVSARRVADDGVVETTEVLNKKLATNEDGIAELEVSPDKGGYYEVKVEAKDDKGNRITQEAFLFASADSGDLPFAPADLEIVTDKRSYFAGDTALVLVLAPTPDAQVLFSVEGGDLYRAEVLKAKRHARLVEVKVGERQTPNFFLGAVTIAGGRVYSRQRSVVVPPRERILSVEVSPDKPKAQPGDDVTFSVTVTNYKGDPVKDAEVALGIVDEAIYAISPEIAVPLEAFFFSRKRNDVRTSDSVSFRFFGTSKSTRDKTAQLTGDHEVRFGSMKPQLDDVRKVFKDTAGWFPALVTDDKGRATATIKLPDNLTSWRATARVMTEDTAVGLGKGNVKSSKPLMVRLALPPRLVEDDSGEGAVVVQNLSGETREVDVSFSAVAAAAEGDPTPPELSLDKPLAQKLKVRHGESKRVPFSWTAKGSGPLKITAKAEGGGLSDGLEARLSVDEWASIERVSISGRTKAGGAVAHTLEVPAGASLDETRLEVELSSSTLAAIRGALPYLVQFPWGCVEQTMSRFLPALAVREVEKRIGLPISDVEGGLDRALAGGVQRLWQLQNDDGGWGWFHDGSDLWMTAYVVEGLGQAKALGEPVDEEHMGRAIKALQRQLSRGRADETLRAFAVFALARHGKASGTMLDELDQQTTADKLPVSALSYLTLAAKLAGQDPIAQRAAAALSRAAAVEGSGVERLEAASLRGAEHAPVEAAATALLALSEVGGHDVVAGRLAADLMLSYGDGRFGTTRQTAFAIRALAKDLKQKPTGKTELVVRVGKREVERISLDETGLTSAALRLSPSVKFKSTSVPIEIEQTSGGAVFHTVSLVAPVRAKKLSAKSAGGLKVSRRYRSLSGAQSAWKPGGQTSAVDMGETILVTLTVDSARALEHVFVEDLRPSGLSAIESDSGLQVKGVQLRPRGVHREHRDDRTAFFLKKLKAGRTQLHYLARGGLVGSYHALPARAEAMYLPARHNAVSASATLEVAGSEGER
jgi:uncharacterized protein YfaS (alpha-2-macroglobulin family)